MPRHSSNCLSANLISTRLFIHHVVMEAASCWPFSWSSKNSKQAWPCIRATDKQWLRLSSSYHICPNSFGISKCHWLSCMPCIALWPSPFSDGRPSGSVAFVKSVSKLEHKPSKSKNDIMMHSNISKKRCDHYTYISESTISSPSLFWPQPVSVTLQAPVFES